MNKIDDKFTKEEYDFCWSCCALEHLGDSKKGLDFVINSLKCIKKDGFAIHTTEFNINSLNNNYDGKTYDANNLVLYRKQDIESLKNDIEKLGHHFYPINYDIGNKVIDNYIDLPPYNNFDIGYHNGPYHLKLKIDNYITTCIGFVIKK